MIRKNLDSKLEHQVFTSFIHSPQQWPIRYHFLSPVVTTRHTHSQTKIAFSVTRWSKRRKASGASCSGKRWVMVCVTGMLWSSTKRVISCHSPNGKCQPPMTCRSFLMIWSLGLMVVDRDSPMNATDPRL